MNRRSALQSVGMILGTSYISSQLFLTSCKTEGTGVVNGSHVLDGIQNDVLAIANTILPAHNTHPGFKSSGAIATMMAILKDCYTAEQHEILTKGIAKLNQDSPLSKMDEMAMQKVVGELDKKYFDKDTKAEDKPTFYGILKESSLLSYFTQKQVMESVLSYKKVPSKYDGAHKIDPNKYDTVYGLGV